MGNISPTGTGKEGPGFQVVPLASSISTDEMGTFPEMKPPTTIGTSIPEVKSCKTLPHPCEFRPWTMTEFRHLKLRK